MFRLLIVIGIICVVFAEDSSVSGSDVQEACANNNPADIVFVLDESGSIWGPDFARQISFVKEVIREFDVEQGATHIGVMTFGNDPLIHFNLGAITDVDAIDTSVDSIAQRRGGTMTYDAIRMMNKEMFSEWYARAGVPHICILITDGESENTEKTAFEAKLAREAGITLFAIGVGHAVNRDELMNIASRPAVEFTFEVDSYGALEALKHILAWEVCQVTTLPPPTTTTTTTTTTTIPTTTLPPSFHGCSSSAMVDLMFSIPDQAGIEGTDYCVSFIQSVVEGTEMSPQQVQVGLTPRRCDQSEAIPLGDLDSEADFTAKVDERRLSTCRTDQHLYYIRTQGGSGDDGGARPESIKMSLLIVDNGSLNSRRTIKEAQKAKIDGIQIIVVGVGDRINEDELREMASGDDSYFHVDDYAMLMSRREEVIARLCSGSLDGAEYQRRSLYQSLLQELSSNYQNKMD